MKKPTHKITDIIVSIIGILASAFFYFYIPYDEFTNGFGDGFVVLIPVFATPVIGLVVGLFMKSRFKFFFPIIPAVFGGALMMYLSKHDYATVLLYFFAFLANTYIGLGIGVGIRALTQNLSEK